MKSRKTWAVLGAALLAMLTAVVVSRGPVAAETLPKIDPTLTGREVGDQLGLDPMAPAEATAQRCVRYATFAEDLGFCLDSVAADPVQAELWGWQITGRPATSTSREFIETNNELRDLQSSDDPDPAQVSALQARLGQLVRLLHDEAPKSQE